MGKCGGIGDLHPTDDRIQGVVSKLKDELTGQVSEKLGTAPDHLHPVGYKTQVVAGTNFFVKLRVAEDKHIHARIYQNLQGELSLHSVTEPKSEADEIEYF